MEEIKCYGGRRSGCTYKYILEKIDDIENKVIKISEKLDTMKEKVDDIDSDMNELFDEVVGINNENNNK